jgi:hypothetical protein
MGKECGSCTACCKLIGVRELDKPAGTPLPPLCRRARLRHLPGPSGQLSQMVLRLADHP